MKHSLLFLLLLCPFVAAAQDVSWLVDEAPIVSAALVKVLEKCPPFSAEVSVNVTGKADPVPTTAAGSIDSQNGNLRWQVKLGDIRSAQLSSNAKAVVRQINGDRFLLLTRPDKHTNYLVLAGAHACLEQPLPSVKLSGKTASGTDTLDGRACSKERLRLTQPDGATNQLVLWRAKDLKNVPVQVEFSDSGQVIRVRFSNVRFQSQPGNAFDVPPGLSKYGSMEDLVQSVLLDKMKRRMGLD
jgi:hypothetical protein